MRESGCPRAFVRGGGLGQEGLWANSWAGTAASNAPGRRTV